MTLSLPPPIAAMIEAHNARDTAAFTACFTDDAVVRDEGQKYFGKPGVKTWFEGVTQKYNPRFQVTSVALVDGEHVLTGQVSGNFDGSPIELRYFTGMEEGKIVALKIAP